MSDRFYVDSSAYLAVLLGENGGPEIATELRGATIASSVLLVLETTRNLVRLSREGTLSSERLAECLSRLEADRNLLELRELTIDLCEGLELPVVSTPRSLDLAHLRTALWFHRRAPLRRFVSTDDALNRSAQELGLPV